MVTQDDCEYAESGVLPWDLESYGRLHDAAMRRGVEIGTAREFLLCQQLFPALSEREALAHVRRHWHVEFALQHFEEFLVEYNLMKPAPAVGQEMSLSQSMMEVLMRSRFNGRTRDKFGTEMPTFHLPQVVTDTHLWESGWRGAMSETDPEADDGRLDSVERVTATTWYWALGEGKPPRKLTARLAEQLVSPMIECDSEGTRIQPSDTAWAGGVPRDLADESGRIRIVGVVVIRVDGAPRYLERTRVCERRLTSIADALDDMLRDGVPPFELPKPVELTESEWESVAGAILHRAHGHESQRRHLAFRLAGSVGGWLPIEVAHGLGDVTAGEHYRVNVDGALFEGGHGLIWDLRWGTLIPSHVPLFRGEPVRRPGEQSWGSNLDDLLGGFLR